MEKLQHVVVRLTISPIGNQIKLPDIKNEQSWSILLNGIDTFIHLAGRAHVLDDKADNPLDESQK